MACAPCAADTAFLFINIAFAMYAGALLSTAARLCWDPTTYTWLRFLCVTQYRAVAVYCLLAGAALGVLTGLAAAALRASLRPDRRPAVTLLRIYWIGVIALALSEVSFCVWLGASLAAWWRVAPEAELARRARDLLDDVKPALRAVTRYRDLAQPMLAMIEACSGLCWAGAVRAWYEPGGAAVRRAGGPDAALVLRAIQRALPAAAAALALAAHLATAAAAAVTQSAPPPDQADTDVKRVERNTSIRRRTILLVLAALVCSALVAAVLAGALWAWAAARGSGGSGIPAAAAAADLLDVLRLLLRVCAKHHLLPDDIDLIVEETIEEFYGWIDALCAIAGLTVALLVLAASAAVALLCAKNVGAAGPVAPTAAHIPSDGHEKELLWDKKSCLRVEEARG